ncbi:MAG: hypothetical protein ACRD50_07020 [Candidatus Acidiferrales bacterium]
MVSRKITAALAAVAAVISIAGWFFPVPLPAQEKQAQPAAMQEPKPGPEMDRLKFLVGDWNDAGDYMKSAMLPEGGKYSGTYRARLGPGGFSLIADFEGEGPGGAEIGHDVFTWDPKANAYKTYSFTNVLPGAIAGTAHWEGANLILESEFEMGGVKVGSRRMYTDIQPKSVTIEEWFRMGDAPYQQVTKYTETKK